MFKWIYTSISCFTALSYASAPSDQEDLTPYESMRVSLRHIEKGGVGYNTGYSTLQMFLSTASDIGSLMPFADLRGHVFNDGKLAANAGLGIRTLSDCRVYGINAYYDYRNAKHQHFNQVSLGLETLGIRWDFRLNGYLPVGEKKSQKYNQKTNLSNPVFDTFHENYLFVKQTVHNSYKIEYAMKGFDAETSFHFLKNRNFDLYAAAGPYYYNYKNAQAVGGRVRLASQIYQYLSLELINSYDSRFHEHFQGQVGINVPFGPRKKPKKDCNFPEILTQRLVQNVQRQEIIVVDKSHKGSSHDIFSLARNPQTQDPYFFVFVDNTSSSLGTYQNPYHSFSQAEESSLPGQILYVFPGDETSKGMNLGISLQDSQMLLGAANAHILQTTVGPVYLPPMASKAPLITNIEPNSPVVTLANNNIISGFSIENETGIGILGRLLSEFTATNNTITGGSYGEGILLSNVSGKITIEDNNFNQTDQISDNNFAVRIYMDQEIECSANFTNNNYSVQSVNGNRVSGIYLDLENSNSLATLDILDNSFAGSTSGFAPFYGINVNLAEGALPTLNISNNTFKLLNEGSACSYINLNLLSNTTTTLNMTNNSFNDISYQGIYIAQTAGHLDWNISDCTLNNILPSSSGIALFSFGATSNINFSNNSLHGINNAAGMGFVLFGGSSIPSLNVSNNLFNEISNNSAAIVAIPLSGSLPSSMSFLDNDFNGIDNSYGLLINQYGADFLLLNVSNNSFTGKDNSSNGWGFFINGYTGSNCVNFTYNEATPTTTPAPYLFSQLSGTLNRTEGSDSSTNTGEISTSGTVGSPGSCSY